MLDFFSQPAGFDIGETGLLLYDASQPLWRALLVGLGNTLRVSLPALVLTTVIALAVALLRRSRWPVWLQVATGYVELIRNVPLLLQLLIWYFLLVEWLPDSTQAIALLPGVWLSKGGLAVPWPWHPDGQLGWDIPVQDVFNVSGGAAMTPECLALMLALAVYTSGFLAEVIRAGLDAVAPSLLEAAETLGATRWQLTWRVWIPQALRTIVPATTNQYLNLIKNSSLAVAVGYPDLVSVSNTAINQTGRVLECMVVMMGVYLLMSLIVSVLMNRFNQRHALKGEA